MSLTNQENIWTREFIEKSFENILPTLEKCCEENISEKYKEIIINVGLSVGKELYEFIIEDTPNEPYYAEIHNDGSVDYYFENDLIYESLTNNENHYITLLKLYKIDWCGYMCSLLSYKDNWCYEDWKFEDPEDIEDRENYFNKLIFNYENRNNNDEDIRSLNNNSDEKKYDILD